MDFELHSELQERFAGADAFAQILRLPGPAVRQREGRRTLRFEWAGRGYYAKLHHGVGWKQIVKCLLAFRWPVLSARDEFRAVQRLERLGVPTVRVVGYGSRGGSPACRESFLLTEELQDVVSLEQLGQAWSVHPPPVRLKWALLVRVADVARALHGNGLNHRDFYLCHFLLGKECLEPPFRPQTLRLYLIDLHRMQSRRATPRRWVIKDLAGLYFSALDVGLTRRDLLRFVRAYEGRPLRDVWGRRVRFWETVERRAVRLYHRIHRRAPVRSGPGLPRRTA